MLNLLGIAKILKLCFRRIIYSESLRNFLLCFPLGRIRFPEDGRRHWDFEETYLGQGASQFGMTISIVIVIIIIVIIIVIIMTLMGLLWCQKGLHLAN